MENKPYGVRFLAWKQSHGPVQIKTVERFFDTEADRAAFLERASKRPAFYMVCALTNPPQQEAA